MRLWRALVAGLRAFRGAFALEWRGVTPEVEVSATLMEKAHGTPIRYQVIRYVDGNPTLVYNDLNGGEAGRYMCAERQAGNVAEFWMETPTGRVRRDWSPR